MWRKFRGLCLNPIQHLEYYHWPTHGSLDFCRHTTTAKEIVDGNGAKLALAFASPKLNELSKMQFRTEYLTVLALVGTIQQIWSLKQSPLGSLVALNPWRTYEQPQDMCQTFHFMQNRWHQKGSPQNSATSLSCSFTSCWEEVSNIGFIMVHGLNKGHIAHYTDTEFQIPNIHHYKILRQIIILIYEETVTRLTMTKQMTFKRYFTTG